MTASAPAWCSTLADDATARAWVAAHAGQTVDCANVPRLPARLLAACSATSAPRFEHLLPQPRAAVLTLGLGPACGLTATAEERRHLDQMPFTARAVGSAITVTVPAQSDRRGSFATGTYHQWAQGVSGETLIAGLGELDHVNSVLIAWLLQLVQSAKPMPVQVRGCRPGVATQLRQLRLDHLLQIG